MSLTGWNIILAQAPAAAGGAQPLSPTGQMVQMVGYLALMGIVFYMLLIRPQSKKAKEHAAMLKTMKSGDKVVTNGGVVGTVVTVKDKTVSIRSADTKLEVLKSAVTEITERPGETSVSES